MSIWVLPKPNFTKIGILTYTGLVDITCPMIFYDESRRGQVQSCQNGGRQKTLLQIEKEMPYVVTEPCIGVKDKSCMTVCPVDCIYEGDKMVYIHPDECIDCGLCEAECPVSAIFLDSDVPANWKNYIQENLEQAVKIKGG